ncbi:hypothetical protein EV121DRAFT_272456 [Schizophyllum commune]
MLTSETSMLVRVGISGLLGLLGIAPAGAATGVICILIGQQVLLATNSDDPSWIAPVADVACIGAVGGAISPTPLILFVAMVPLSGSSVSVLRRVASVASVLVQFVTTGPAFATIAGAIGASILDLHGGSVLSVGKASEACVIGHAVLLAAIVALIVAGVVIMSCFGMIMRFIVCHYAVLA